MRLRSRLRARKVCTGLLLAVTAFPLSACKEVEEETAAGYEPAKLGAVKGSEDVKRVTFTAEGAQRVGLRTAPVRTSGKDKVVPYEALIYDGEGKTYVYTSPARLTFVRERVRVDHVAGKRVLLTAGPRAGTDVVTVGATEVYGTEFEVGH